MSEQTTVNPILDQFLQKSVEYLSSAEAFLKTEVPAFVQELLAWEFYSSLMCAVALGLVCVISIVLFIRFEKKDRIYFEKRGYHDSDIVGGQIGCGAVALITFLLTFYSVHSMVKIKVAPRVYLLEQVRHLTE